MFRLFLNRPRGAILHPAKTAAELISVIAGGALHQSDSNRGVTTPPSLYVSPCHDPLDTSSVILIASETSNVCADLDASMFRPMSSHRPHQQQATILSIDQSSSSSSSPQSTSNSPLMAASSSVPSLEKKFRKLLPFVDQLETSFAVFVASVTRKYDSNISRSASSLQLHLRQSRSPPSSSPCDATRASASAAAGSWPSSSTIISSFSSSSPLFVTNISCHGSFARFFASTSLQPWARSFVNGGGLFSPSSIRLAPSSSASNDGINESTSTTASNQDDKSAVVTEEPSEASVSATTTSTTVSNLKETIFEQKLKSVNLVEKVELHELGELATQTLKEIVNDVSFLREVFKDDKLELPAEDVQQCPMIELVNYQSGKRRKLDAVYPGAWKKIFQHLPQTTSTDINVKEGVISHRQKSPIALFEDAVSNASMEVKKITSILTSQSITTAWDWINAPDATRQLLLFEHQRLLDSFCAKPKKDALQEVFVSLHARYVKFMEKNPAEFTQVPLTKRSLASALFFDEKLRNMFPTVDEVLSAETLRKIGFTNNKEAESTPIKNASVLLFFIESAHDHVDAAAARYVSANSEIWDKVCNVLKACRGVTLAGKPWLLSPDDLTNLEKLGSCAKFLNCSAFSECSVETFPFEIASRLLVFVDSQMKLAEEAQVLESQVLEHVELEGLLPGSSHRHTPVASYGQRARINEIKRLAGIVGAVGVAKETKPLITLISMPRQGKTLFLDSIGYSPSLVPAFKMPENSVDEEQKRNPSPSKEAEHKQSEGKLDQRVVIVNTTLNANWPIVDQKYTFEEAKREILLRMVGAVFGKFTSEHEHKFLPKLVGFLVQLRFSDAVNFIKTVVSERLQTKSKQCTFFFLFDEITKLTDLMSSESAKRIYSSLGTLCGERSFVVVSGFNHAHQTLSISDRRLQHIILKPATQAEQRRQLHVMKSTFINASSLVAPFALNRVAPSGSNNELTDGSSSEFADAFLVYELVKASPGMIGSVCEKVVRHLVHGEKASNDELITTINEAVKVIPIISSIDNDIDSIRSRDKSTQDKSQRRPEWISSVLAMKSIQFVGKPLASTGRFSGTVSDTLQKSETLGIAQVTFDKTDAMKSLRSTRLEPLMLLSSEVRAGEVSFLLQRYTRGFLQLGKLLASISTDERPVSSDDDRPASSDEEKRFFIEYDDNEKSMMERRFDMFSEASPTKPTPTKTRSTRNGIEWRIMLNPDEDGDHRRIIGQIAGRFLEDGVGLGILVQRQMRMKAFILNFLAVFDADSVNFTSTLDKFLQHSPLTVAKKKNKVEDAQQQNEKIAVSRYAMGVDISELTVDFSYSLACKVELDDFAKEARRCYVTAGRNAMLQEVEDAARRFGTTSADTTRTGAHSPLMKKLIALENQHRTKIQASVHQFHGTIAPEDIHLFDTRTLLLPARPESNALFDIMFHEKVHKKNELIQFWVDTERRKQHENSSPAARSRRALKAANIVYGLQSKALRKASLRKRLPVRHVVHIVISSARAEDLLHDFEPERLPDGGKETLKFKSGTVTGLKSYTLILVNPDDLNNNKALENLVSQPIALTLPLMEQRMEDSGTNSIPAPKEWWSYRATNPDAAKLVRKPKTEVGEWRRLIFDQDFAMGTCHKHFKSQSEVEPNISILPEDAGHKDVITNLLCSVPYGCVLEALGLLPLRCNGQGYAIDPQLQPIEKLTPEMVGGGFVHFSPALFKSARNRSPELRSAADAIERSYIKLDVRSRVTIGHLLHHHQRTPHGEQQRMKGYDYDEHEETKKFWDNLLNESENQLTSNNYQNSGKSSSDNWKIACGQLFTMTVEEWNKQIRLRSLNNKKQRKGKDKYDYLFDVLLPKKHIARSQIEAAVASFEHKIQSDKKKQGKR